ncbi:DNA-binding protein [Micromonospora sp. NPDC047707]|uniref:DNA-binding protein n=1 Tax=Micromonospora sp. NPDC047707 TaxID=3154498 RepID=UPI0034570B30
MQTNRASRRCSCGAGLARDNRTNQCSSCYRRQSARLLTPPTLPTGFWDTSELQAAFADRHIGRVIRAYRHHPHHGMRPLPQEVVAGWMGQTQAQLSRLENGLPLRDLDRLAAWAALLGMPQQLLWFALPAGSPAGDSPAAPREPDLRLLRSLRSADRRVGGGHLYATVSSYLAEHGSSLTRHGARAAASPAFLAATASLHEMAGWMAHDAGAAPTAREHLMAASYLARDSGDQQLKAQVFASLSHLASYQGNANDALTYSISGLEAARTAPSHGLLKARLLAIQARSLAIAGKPAEAMSVLEDAERALSEETVVVSKWLSPFDETSFAIEAARCFLRIGDLAEAHRRLEDALTARARERVRSRLLAQLMLVTALLGRGLLDEACVVAHRVLELTTGLSSAVVVEHLRHVEILLKPHASRSAEAQATMVRIGEAIRENAWIGIMGGLHSVISAGQAHAR